MTFKRLLCITPVLISLASCTAPVEKHKTGTGIAASSPDKPAENLSNVDIEIALNGPVSNYGDKIELNISLTNNGKSARKLLFDQQPILSGGPLGISARVTDKKTKRSVLKYGNKEMLSSQLYTEDQLKDDYHILQAKQSVHGKYALNDIVIFDNEDNLLPAGTYEIQIDYYCHGEPSAFISSNIVTLTIKQ